jgi:rubrerythrin
MASLRKSVLTAVFWKAVRLAAPIALASCGPMNVQVLEHRAPACTTGVRATCNEGTVRVATDLPAGTELSPSTCDAVCVSINCVGEKKKCTVEDQPLTKEKHVRCTPTGFEGCAVAGRPPAGLEPMGERPRTARAVFERMAHEEAASVVSFEELAAFLQQSGAPARLVKKARKAAREEKRHAQIAAAIAGLTDVPVPRVRPRTVPLTLAQLAEENFCDGCINEGASAVATLTQAERASDLTVRRLLAQVAEDEVGHAELSWELHAWLVPKLTAEERLAVRAAGLRKVAAMLAFGGHGLDAQALAQTGLAGDVEVRGQMRLLFEELWSPALERLA